MFCFTNFFFLMLRVQIFFNALWGSANCFFTNSSTPSPPPSPPLPTRSTGPSLSSYFRDIGQKRNFHTKSLKNSISQRRIRLLDLLTSRLGLLWENLRLKSSNYLTVFGLGFLKVARLWRMGGGGGGGGKCPRSITLKLFKKMIMKWNLVEK